MSKIMSFNQFRQGIKLGPSPGNNTKPKIDNTLPYRGRRLDKDSLRLVEIQPATHKNDPVVCRLIEVTVGSKPKFEALSYTWGAEKANDTITLNGLPFQIRRNLLDALLSLRNQVISEKQCQLFWIDALCINQSDVEERNQQLRIMDQIYFRASTVVVWLGSKYAEFQSKMLGKLGSKKAENIEADSPLVSSNTKTELVKVLRSDPYWDRLWILQEIGRAKKLRVSFGNESFEWERFILFIATHSHDGSTGPLRLDRLLRREKSNDSHTLRKLLEEYKEAKCSEPRDKVYGLVGLASDATKFPMDYRKSLYEVWKDTMAFMNECNLFKEESQILETGALVKSLLMANHSDPLGQLAKEQVDPRSPLVFRLQAALLGCVVCVGPSANDIVSRPDEAAQWRITTQRAFPADELGSAQKEYDTLFHHLLELDESAIERACINRPSPVIWEEQKFSGPVAFPKSALQYIKGLQQEMTAKNPQWPQMLQQVTHKSASVQPRLYLAKEFGGHTQRKMGVASGVVQANDVVVRVHHSRKALLVRVVDEKSPRPKMRVVGMAQATVDMGGPNSANDDAQRWNSTQKGCSMEVQVDAGTVFMLLD